MLDAALGDTVQSFTLFTPEELEPRFRGLHGISIVSSPCGTVFSLYELYAAVFALEDGPARGELPLRSRGASRAGLGRSEEGGELWLFLSGVDHVPGGGRCASIYEVRYCEPDNEDDMARGWAVAVYEDGGDGLRGVVPGLPSPRRLLRIQAAHRRQLHGLLQAGRRITMRGKLLTAIFALRPRGPARYERRAVLRRGGLHPLGARRCSAPGTRPGPSPSNTPSCWAGTARRAAGTSPPPARARATRPAGAISAGA